MESTTKNQDAIVKRDEDVKFENDKEAAIVPLTDIKESNVPVGETTLPLKEDTLGNSDFPPLTEQEKRPKLPKED